MALSLAGKRLTIIIVSLALFMDVLDSNIINTAIPAMSRSLHVNPVDIKIALISYLLSLAVFIPISGWTAEKYGTKYVFVGAIGLFTISSFFCGYSHTLGQLVLARTIQGVGGAFMLSLGRLIIARTFKQQELIEAMNIVVIVISVAVMLGPYVGGVITDRLSWPWIFWVNIPAGIFAMTIAALGLRDTAERHPRPFDKLGFVLFGGGLAIFCFALSELSDSRASIMHELTLLGAGAAMIATYFVYAQKVPHPVISTELFRLRTFQVSVLGNLLSRLSFGGVPFLLPLLLQIGFGYSAELAGLLLVPIAFGIVFAKLAAFRLMRFWGYRRFLIINTITVCFLLWLLQHINHDTSLMLVAGMTFIFGIGMAMQFTALNSLAFAELHEDELSTATSITSTTQQLSQSFGVAVAAILLRLFSTFSDHPFVLTPNVFDNAFFALGILTFMSSFLFLRLRKHDGNQMLVMKQEVKD